MKIDESCINHVKGGAEGMNELIGCRHCESPDCRGCNIYTLATALKLGWFDGLMDGNRAVEIHADVVERKRGKWEFKQIDVMMLDGVTSKIDVVQCSNCRKNAEYKSDFCPSCGADMREPLKEEKP